MSCKFHHIALKVKDFDKAVSFYKELLALKERIRWDMDGTPAIMLEMADGGIVEIFGNGTDEAEVNPRWPHLAVLVEDVPAVYKKALELGARSSIEPTKTAIEGQGKTLNVEIAFVFCPGGGLLEFFKEL